MNLVLLISLLFSGNFQIPGSQLGVFTDLTITKYSGGYVVVSRSENCIVLLSAEGKITARYDQRGNGPRELSNPVYLGHYRNLHVVLTQNQFLLWLDDRLIPRKGEVARIDQSEADALPIFGLVTEKAWYWVNSGMSFSDVLTTVVPTKSGFTKQKSMFPQAHAYGDISKKSSYLQKMSENHHITVHDTKFFKTNLAVPLANDEYTVEIYLDPFAEKKPDMVLAADISDMAIIYNSTKCVIGKSMSFHDGFIVTWEGKRKPSDAELTKFADVYSVQGGFKRRLTIDNSLFPCLNKSEAFTFVESNESEFLRRFSSVSEFESIIGD